MAQQPSVNKPWRLLVSGSMYYELHSHLFPGDRGEHGAVILAGLAETDRDVRLLARELHLALDNHDYVPGKRGYRMLRADFIKDRVLQARDEQLVYLAVHNHAGSERVAFSNDDLRSHERGYPALLQITRGTAVGALVLAKDAIAGDLWISDLNRVPLESATVIGCRRQRLFPEPPVSVTSCDPQYDRQVRLFGDRGQDILSDAKVSILGLGGIGSILVELIARLGVGRFVIVDPDRVTRSNLPRLVGAAPWDTAPRFLNGTLNRLRPIERLLSRRKTTLARRSIRRANPEASVQALAMDVVEPEVVEHLKDCDYMFLAADTMRARNLFNSLVHQYLIPGVQVGTKIRNDDAGRVNDVYAVTRPVTPEAGCLRCSKFINPSKLQEESLSDEEEAAQRYVDDPKIVAPSVITLNALSAAQAANDFLFYMTGLSSCSDTLRKYMYFRPRKREVSWDQPTVRPDCIDCGRIRRGRFAKGDSGSLPVKMH